MLLLPLYFLIILNFCKTCASTSRMFTSYSRNVKFSVKVTKSVIIDQVRCVYYCFVDNNCYGVGYNEFQKKCDFYSHTPNCRYQKREVGLVIFLPQDALFKNIALNKPTNMSSSYGGYTDSCQSVDGYLKTIMHTNADPLEWWCVDLEMMYNFQYMVIYNIDARYQSTVNRISGFELRLHDNGQCNTETYYKAKVCYRNPPQTVPKLFNITSCNQPEMNFSSRFIFISPRKNNFLHFKELLIQ